MRKLFLTNLSCVMNPKLLLKIIAINIVIPNKVIVPENILLIKLPAVKNLYILSGCITHLPRNFHRCHVIELLTSYLKFTLSDYIT